MRARNRRPWAETDEAKRAERARAASRKAWDSGRRRGVDPSTSEIDYTPDELEFMMAMQAYKEASLRPFPTWCEVLEVVKGLGYEKRPG